MNSPVMTRDEYEMLWLQRKMAQGLTPEQLDLAKERHYPKGTKQVQQELRFRGIDATDWRVQDFAATCDPPLHQYCGVRLWFRGDIDRLAGRLEEQGKLTPDAQFRKNHGLTWKQQASLLAQIDPIQQ